MTSKTMRPLAVALVASSIGVVDHLCVRERQGHAGQLRPAARRIAVSAPATAAARPTEATVGRRDNDPVPEAGPPSCPDSLKLCAETFTYPYNGEQSVELARRLRGGRLDAGRRR